MEPLNNPMLPMDEVKSVQCYCGRYWNFVVSAEQLVAGRDRLNSGEEFVYYGARCEHCGRFLLDTYLKKERRRLNSESVKDKIETRGNMQKCDFLECVNSTVAHIEYGNNKYGSNLRFYCAEHYNEIVKYVDERRWFQNPPLKIKIPLEVSINSSWEQSDTGLSPEIAILHVSLKESDDILKHWKK